MLEVLDVTRRDVASVVGGARSVLADPHTEFDARPREPSKQNILSRLAFHNFTNYSNSHILRCALDSALRCISSGFCRGLVNFLLFALSAGSRVKFFVDG